MLDSGNFTKSLKSKGLKWILKCLFSSVSSSVMKSFLEDQASCPLSAGLCLLRLSSLHPHLAACLLHPVPALGLVGRQHPWLLDKRNFISSGPLENDEGMDGHEQVCPQDSLLIMNMISCYKILKLFFFCFFFF